MTYVAINHVTLGTEIRFAACVHTIMSATPADAVRMLAQFAVFFFVTFYEGIVATVPSLPGVAIADSL